MAVATAYGVTDPAKPDAAGVFDHRRLAVVCTGLRLDDAGVGGDDLLIVPAFRELDQ